MTQETQQTADIVVVGGGIIGCSIAFHLAKSGAQDILLLEKAALTHGSTWHAAGVVGQLRTSRNLSYLLQQSIRLYKTLEEETGHATGWRQTGSVKMVSSELRMRQIKRDASFAKAIGIEAEIITPREVQDLFPALEVSDLLGALYVPEDGVADPSMLTNALAAGARKMGVRINQGTRVTGVIREGQRVKGVVTDAGPVECRILVNAAGLWARELGEMLGVRLPCCAIQSQYIITDPSPGIKADLPSLRDVDESVYFKPESNGLIVGFFERNSEPFDFQGIRPDFAQELLPPDFDRFAPFMEPATKRMPLLESIGIREVVNGPIPFSPDGEMVLGKVPGLENAFVAAGCPIGIAAGGGVGELMAEWILTGRSPIDVAEIDVRRFGEVQSSRAFMYPSAIEAYGNHYASPLAMPTLSASRGYRTSPLHDLLESRNAVFDPVCGWERPAWFRGTMDVDDGEGPYDSKESFDAVGREHAAVCNSVGLFDLTSSAKFEIRGAAALETLERLSIRTVGGAIGENVPTLFCNEKGGIEGVVEIMRLADEAFYLVTDAEHGARVGEWLRVNAPAGSDVSIEDVTSHFGVLLVAGPNARQIVRTLMATEWDIEGRDMDRGTVGTLDGIPARICPDGTAFPSGWRIHAPMDGLRHLYCRIRECGEALGVADCGFSALKTLRVEAGAVAWGLEVNMETTPHEAGMGALVEFDKGDFVGRAALLAERERGAARVLTLLSIDQQIQLIGNELVIEDGEIVGTTLNPCFSYAANKWIAHAYLPRAGALARALSLEAYGEVMPATSSPPGSFRAIDGRRPI